MEFKYKKKEIGRKKQVHKLKMLEWTLDNGLGKSNQLISKLIFFVIKYLCFHARVLICVANDSQKKTSSSVGMKNSVETSPLLKYRAEHCVPQRTREMMQAIQVQSPC